MVKSKRLSLIIACSLINALIISACLFRFATNDDYFLGKHLSVRSDKSSSDAHNDNHDDTTAAFMHFNGSTCRQVYAAHDQCQFAMDNCQQENMGYFAYINSYYCSRTSWDAAVTVLLVFFWAACLFMTIGIAAYDFLCPNLNTISKLVGFSETLAGVTFLAFGNGSPDIFSTYAAMKTGSGSLAVGELLGAAVFITTVITGSMAVISPFHVPKYSFLRDIGFFLVSIMCALIIISDGILKLWECMAMFILYLSYVVMVVAWHYYVTSASTYKPSSLLVDGSNYGELERQALSSHNNAMSYSSVNEHEQPENSLGVGPARRHSSLDNNRQSAASPRHHFEDLFDDIGHQADSAGFDDDYSERYGEFTKLMRANRKHDLESQYFSRGRSDSDGLVGLDSYHHRNKSHQSPSPFHHPTNEHSNASEELHPRRPSLARHRTSLPGLTTSGADYSRTPPHMPAEPSIRPSFVSAIEFSDALKKLQRHKAIRSPLMPMTATGTAVSSPLTQVQSADAVVPDGVNLDTINFNSSVLHGVNYAANHNAHQHINRATDSPSPTCATGHDSTRLSPRTHELYLQLPTEVSSSPSFHLSPPSPTKSLLSIEQELMEEEHNQTHKVFDTLFPSLRDLSEKSWYGLIVSIIAAPSSFLLTISVPVYESGIESSDEDEPEILDNTGELAQNDQNDGGEVLSADITSPNDASDKRGENENLKIPRWLIAIQLFLCPLTFCLLNNGLFKAKIWLFSVPATLSVLLLTVLNLYIPAHMPNHQANHRLRIISILGFIIAVSWIAIIANEVVAVLKAIGIIFNISDSILGLTLFAVGNSLGDLVANMTIAKMGYPKMAFSACFGGPLLNILVGIGVSGMAVTLKEGGFSRNSGYHIDISSTLIISGVTLLITSLFFIIVVPLNGFKMTRTIGIVTISFWTISTILNLMVELYMRYF